ncbi:MAG: hypothetical protein WC967_13335 [Balneolaceae bacterium]
MARRSYSFLFTLSILFVLGGWTSVYAQTSASSDSISDTTFIAPTIVADTTVVDVRLPNKSIIESYYINPDFQYEGVPPNPNTFIGMMIYWATRLLSYIIGTPVGNFILKVVVYVSIAGVVILLLNQLLDGNLVNILRRRKSDKSISPNISEEELEKLDFEALYASALDESNFADATRYAFLIVLKLLYNKELIQFSIEKTNHDYASELEGKPVAPLFKKLAYYYEYVEYGDFEIDEIKFKIVQQTLQLIKEGLK